MAIDLSDSDVLQGHLRTVFEKDIGTVIAVDAVAGDDGIIVEKTLGFPIPAGALLVNAQVVTYSALDAGTGAITLDAGLDVDAVAGDEVLLYDTELDAVAVDTKALVQPDGVGGDTLEATVDHSLIDTLAPGSRDGEGESVLCRRITGEWWLEKILGKPLVRDGAVIELGVYLGRFRAADTTLEDSTWTTLHFGNKSSGPDRRITYDPDTFTATVEVRGIYLIIARVSFATNGVGERRVRLLKNGEIQANLDRDDGATDPIVQLVTAEPLEVGDVLAIQAFQNSGDDLDVLGAANLTNVRITLLGGA